MQVQCPLHPIVSHWMSLSLLTSWQKEKGLTWMWDWQEARGSRKAAIVATGCRCGIFTALEAVRCLKSPDRPVQDPHKLDRGNHSRCRPQRQRDAPQD